MDFLGKAKVKGGSFSLLGPRAQGQWRQQAAGGQPGPVELTLSRALEPSRPGVRGGHKAPRSAVPLDGLTDGPWDLEAEPPEAAADPQPAWPCLPQPQPRSPGFNLALRFGLRGQDPGGTERSGTATSAQPGVRESGTGKIAG